MPHVVLTDFVAADLSAERGVLDGVADITALGATSEAELLGKVEDADVLMVFNLPVREATISRLTKCKLIVRCGVGFDNIDHAFARTRGIPVANVPDYGTEEIADTAIGMALTLARGIGFYNSRLRRGAGAWSYRQAVPLRRLRGETFGVVGLGRIGTATALRAKALGMHVVYFDPYHADGVDKALGVKRAETLVELLAASLVVSLNCPLTPETHQMINAAAIAHMRHGAYLVNTGRGGLVDTAAIPPAILSGKLAGAGIDVLPDEPPADADPLIVAWRNENHPAFDRVIVNPHAAFYSEEGLLDIRVKGATACRRAILGQPLRNIVN